MTSNQKTAIITGGASGMGLAVAQALASTGNWDLHLVDLNEKTGSEAAILVSGTFHKSDITQYASLASVFKAVFEKTRRLDFVFANAGIAEKGDFYDRHDDLGLEPPPEPNMLVSKILVDAVITTSYLALHYFRLSPRDASTDQSLIITASCGGLYPSNYSPIYSGAKHAAVGFMRSIARGFWNRDKIRVNAICPGTVKTNLLTATEWTNFPDEYFTPVEKIVEAVLMLIDGKDNTTGYETRIDGKNPDKNGTMWGEAVEVSGKHHYFREPPRFSDEAMERVMKATQMEEYKQ